MKTFYGYLQRYFQDEEFDWVTHVLVLLLCGLLITVNYSTGFTKYMKSTYRGELGLWGFYILQFCLMYFITFGMVRWRQKVWSKPGQQLGLWIAFIGMTILALDYSFYLLPVLTHVLPDTAHAYFYYCLSYGVRMIAIFTPLLVLHFAFKPIRSNFFGFGIKPKDMRKYAILLACMLPLLLAGSFLPGLLTYYPTYIDFGEDTALGLPHYATVLFYEFCYGSGFINVEIFFRGFLVVGLSRLLGRDAILPMVVCYCAIHFNKPMAETISSVFGGFILGVISLYSRNIYGGILVHLGIAWGMEAIAFWLG